MGVQEKIPTTHIGACIMPLFNVQKVPAAKFPHLTGIWDLVAYARVYWEAAQRLAESGTSSSLDAYPVAFLYRHALELAIKSILVENTPLHSHCEADILKRGHNLKDQIQDLQTVLTNRSAELEGFKFSELVAVVDDWDKYDPDSYAFRYSVKKDAVTPASSAIAVEEEFRFDLLKFAETMDRTLDYLFSAKTEIDREIMSWA